MKSKRDLDGDPKDFPKRESAMKEYSELWIKFKDCKDERQMFIIGQNMENIQNDICIGPGKVWLEFCKTLPGYTEFWESFYDDNKEVVDDYLKENELMNENGEWNER